jgi:nitroreductase
MTTTADAAPIPTPPPLTMPLEEARRTPRARRRLRPDPVDDALVWRLIELALKAPTGRNAQNWEFVLVKDRAVKARLARLYRTAWGLYGRLGRRLTARDPKMQRQLKAVQWQVEHFEEIPVLVVACLRSLRPVWPPVAVTSYYGPIHPSVQNLLLAARAAGLGPALITLPLWSTWLARRALSLPWRVTPCAVVPLGWPLGRYGPTTRRPVGAVVHLDRDATSRSRPSSPDGVRRPVGVRPPHDLPNRRLIERGRAPTRSPAGTAFTAASPKRPSTSRACGQNINRFCSRSQAMIVLASSSRLSLKKCPSGLGPLGFGNTTYVMLGTREPCALAAASNMDGSNDWTIISPSSRTSRTGRGIRAIQ